MAALAFLNFSGIRSLPLLHVSADAVFLRGQTALPQLRKQSDLSQMM